MGYRIDYAPKQSLGARTARWFLVFLLLVSLLWPRGRNLLGQVLFPGDRAVTVAALEHMAGELEDGKPLKGALEDFCRSILEASP